MVILKSGKFDVCNSHWHSAIARAICQPFRCNSYHFCIFFLFLLVGGFVLFCFASQLSSFNPSAQKGGSTLTLLWRLSGYEHPFTFYVLLLLLFCPVVFLVARHLCIVLLWSCTIPVYLKAEHISTQEMKFLTSLYLPALSTLWLDQWDFFLF